MGGRGHYRDTRMRSFVIVPTSLWLTILLVASSAGWSLSGCGGKAVLDGDAGAAEGGSDADPFAGVQCGNAGSCTFSCCLDLTQEDAAPFCATSCGTNVSSFGCDGPEDCDGGACCGDILGNRCKPACESSDLTFCHDDEHCDDGFCSEALVSGVAFDTCMR